MSYGRYDEGQSAGEDGCDLCRSTIYMNPDAIQNVLHPSEIGSGKLKAITNCQITTRVDQDSKKTVPGFPQRGNGFSVFPNPVNVSYGKLFSQSAQCVKHRVSCF